MKLRWLKRLFRLALLIAGLGAVLFSGYLVSVLARPTFLHVVAVEAQAACRDKGTQWMVVICLCVYLVAFRVLEPRMNADSQWWHLGNANLWLGALAMLALAQYALAYQGAASSTKLLMLLAGMTLCKGVRVWARWPGDRKATARRTALVLGILVLLMGGGACWRPEMVQAFHYRGQTRWSGPWENPNTFGVLMGVGLTLALGQLLSTFKSPAYATLWPEEQVSSGQALRASIVPQSSTLNPQLSTAKADWLRRLKMAFFVVAAGMLAIGLVKSYSRGAWVGAALALTYLCYQVFKFSSFEILHSARGWVYRNWISVAVIALSLVVVAFWNFRHTEKTVIRRSFSVANVNDFSWRNRLAGYEGALQMMADRPWFGFGWNQPEPVYENYYRAGKVAEGTAIQLNDFFTLGMTLGLSALACFWGYVWLSLARNGERGARNGPTESAGQGVATSHLTSDFASATCRAGAMVLLVGFWFDGGLFKLATGATFWILLELGSQTGARNEGG